ncbi:poly(hydroxyalkanoate) depolymerase family esterase [Natronocella acetinitrilica]|uniref:Poly(Hydroxyalkanoate) depolymerase family esterase n=1 Tax=Natronocella acetinitrilica TaxID=414046 RepID=A0AAE3G768_9GAMM|nr:PHB depolymerase family esterase [Natronocella acetinitrilica]MCP1677070.1 poly(hydroxyalkanoate) depolymerase family esterase [Natronocella acetinitrilica]
MNQTLHAVMLEATRLTNAGQLAEATAMIQRALNGNPAPTSGGSTSEYATETRRSAPGHSTARREEDVIEGSFHVVGSNGSRRPHGRKDGPCAFRARPASPRQKPQEAPAPGRFLARTFSNKGGSLNYKLYVPTAYREQPLPLVIMLHGCTQSPDDFAAGTRMNHLAETTPCLVAYPAQNQSANISRCWNWFKPSDQQRDQGEPAVIAGITREIARVYAVDSRRIYVAGLSSGGSMAAIMGATYPDLFAAVGIHSGPDYSNAHDLPSAFAAMHGSTVTFGLRQGATSRTARPGRPFVPNIMFHGDQDHTVRPGESDTVSEHWGTHRSSGHSENGADAALDVRRQHGQVPNGHTYTQSSFRDPAGKVMAEHWLIHGAGHAWSGGSASGTYTDGRGPDASAEMLRFFLEHKLVSG